MEIFLKLAGTILRKAVAFCTKKYPELSEGYYTLRTYLPYIKIGCGLIFIMSWVAYHAHGSLFISLFVCGMSTYYYIVTSLLCMYKLARFKEPSYIIENIFARNLKARAFPRLSFYRNLCIFDIEEVDKDGRKIRYTEVIVPLGTNIEEELESPISNLTPVVLN